MTPRALPGALFLVMGAGLEPAGGKQWESCVCEKLWEYLGPNVAALFLPARMHFRESTTCKFHSQLVFGFVSLSASPHGDFYIWFFSPTDFLCFCKHAVLGEMDPKRCGCVEATA